MFKLIQKINKNYWFFYIKKYKNSCYSINYLLKKKKKIERFIKYLIRVNKPIFYRRLRKKYIVYKEKWLDLNRLNNKYYIIFKKLNRKQFIKKKNRKNIDKINKNRKNIVKMNKNRKNLVKINKKIMKTPNRKLIGVLKFTY